MTPRPGRLAELYRFLHGWRGEPPAVGLPSPDGVRALLAAGAGRNRAVTVPGATDPTLRPRLVKLPPDATRERLLRAVPTLRGWRVAGASERVVWATRRTRLWRFVDDVYLLLEPFADGTRVLAWSGSRLGRGDLGQNRRNLGELWRALDQARGE